MNTNDKVQTLENLFAELGKIDRKLRSLFSVEIGNAPDFSSAVFKCLPSILEKVEISYFTLSLISLSIELKQKDSRSPAIHRSNQSGAE